MEITNVPVRLSGDPEPVTTHTDGKVVVNFNAAYNWRARVGDQFADVDVTFFRCTLWEEAGASEFTALGIRKGALVRVSGRWTRNRWTDRNGQSRIGDNLTVTAVSVSQETTIAPPEPSEEPADEDVSIA